MSKHFASNFDHDRSLLAACRHWRQQAFWAELAAPSAAEALLFVIALRATRLARMTLVEHGVDIRTIQVLLGHESLETTMIYTHVARKGPASVASPLDFLADLTPEAIEEAAAASRRMHSISE